MPCVTPPPAALVAGSVLVLAVGFLLGRAADAAIDWIDDLGRGLATVISTLLLWIGLAAVALAAITIVLASTGHLHL